MNLIHLSKRAERMQVPILYVFTSCLSDITFLTEGFGFARNILLKLLYFFGKISLLQCNNLLTAIFKSELKFILTRLKVRERV